MPFDGCGKRFSAAKCLENLAVVMLWRHKVLALQADGLEVKDSVHGRRTLPLQKSDGHVVHWNAARCLSVALAIVGVPMEHQVGAVPVHDLGKARGSQEWVNFVCLSFDGRSNR